MKTTKGKYKRIILTISLALILFSLLILAETKLPFFQKFLPVGENKLLIFLLNVNLLLILLILFLIVRSLVKTYIEKKRGIWGSRLKTKLTLTLIFVSIIPAFTLFVLASGFFKESMDRWFDEKIETAIESAFQISNFYYEDLFKRYEVLAVHMAEVIERKNLEGKKLEDFLSSKAKEYNLDYLFFYPHTKDEKGIGPGSVGKDIEDTVLREIKGARENQIRKILPMKKGEIILSGLRLSKGDVLIVGSYFEPSGFKRIKEIASIYSNFKEQRPFKKILKYSFLIPLSLIALCVLFFSIWMGMKMAEEITVPIEKVKEGVSVIAKGDFDINLEERTEDEIGTLVRAFNDMAKELKRTKEEIEEKSRYLELILENVGTGIISLDKKGSIILMNDAAKRILELKNGYKGKRIGEILNSELSRYIRPLLKEALKKGSLTKEIGFPSKKGIVSLRISITLLKDGENKIKGFLITFEDITQLLKAERLSTWRKVARRLTHEIKNPLTPINLSTERIRRKFLPILKGEEKEVIEETTSVILKSLEEIKGIINDLTRLTHISQTKNLEDIKEIIEESLSLYRNLYPTISFSFESTPIPPFLLDREAMKRVFVNLITNSIKAIGDREGKIDINASFDSEKNLCIIEFSDSGKGIPEDEKLKIFDPYYTKNKEGLGLGLAIVQSIILEHHGRIHVTDNIPRGAKFIIELPLLRE